MDPIPYSWSPIISPQPGTSFLRGPANASLKHNKLALGLLPLLESSFILQGHNYVFYGPKLVWLFREAFICIFFSEELVVFSSLSRNGDSFKWGPTKFFHMVIHTLAG